MNDEDLKENHEYLVSIFGNVTRYGYTLIHIHCRRATNTAYEVSVDGGGYHWVKNKIRIELVEELGETEIVNVPQIQPIEWETPRL